MAWHWPGMVEYRGARREQVVSPDLQKDKMEAAKERVEKQRKMQVLAGHTRTACTRKRLRGRAPSPLPSIYVNRAARSITARCALMHVHWGSASQALQSFSLKQAVKQLPNGFKDFVGKDGKVDKQGEAALGDYFQK